MHIKYDLNCLLYTYTIHRLLSSDSSSLLHCVAARRVDIDLTAWAACASWAGWRLQWCEAHSCVTAPVGEAGTLY